MRASGVNDLKKRPWSPRKALILDVSFIAAIVVAISGCATYSGSFGDIEAYLIQDQPQQALAELEQRRRFSRDEVLYLLNRAMLLRMDGAYGDSNEALEGAKKLIEKREAFSITEQTTSLVVNEALRSFIGEDFERALIHLYAALNYLQLGQPFEARVEALQVDVLLRRLEDKNSKNPRVYTEDALCRYISAMIFEELGEWSDAMIAYRKAYEAYTKYAKSYGTGIPIFLHADLLRLSSRQGLREEFKRYEQEFPETVWLSVEELQNVGELVFILHGGLAPIKRSHETRVIDPGSGRLISIALPSYEVRPNPIARVRVTVAGRSENAVVVEDVSAIARQTLEVAMPAITARAIGRTVIKDQLARRAAKENGALSGFIVNLAGALTEVADTRSWVTLPSNIYMARIPLQPGDYTVRVDVIDVRGHRLKQFEFENVNINRRQKTYVEKHWLSPAV